MLRRAKRGVSHDACQAACGADRGFGPIEALGVIATSALMATTADNPILRFLDRGHNTKATSTIAAAVTEAKEL